MNVLGTRRGGDHHARRSAARVERWSHQAGDPRLCRRGYHRRRRPVRDGGDRIAVFDNDGTLWCEQPLYIQLGFALDRVRSLAPEHPEWREQPPFNAILANDRDALAGLTKRDLAALIAATHAGMTTEAFAEVVRAWIGTAKHPRFERLYTECVYQPMLELLDYLRANGFQTWIVSGGGVDFMRVFAEAVYGIPPAQVIGSSGKVQFEPRDGRPVLVKLPELSSFDDKEGKPANIHLHVGRRPILAGGNSDGDLAMLQYTAGRDGRSPGAHRRPRRRRARVRLPGLAARSAGGRPGRSRAAGLDRRQHERRLEPSLST